jgi:hypothetical protein
MITKASAEWVPLSQVTTTYWLKARPMVTPDYAIPSTSFDWERSRATRHDLTTASLFEYVDMVVHRDDVLVRWPAGSELFSLKLGMRGMHIDLKELGRRVRDRWRQ